MADLSGSSLRAAVLEHLTTGHSSSGFSVYRAFREQRLFNVPLVQPMLMAVLSGSKHYGDEASIHAEAGSFLLVSESQSSQMRNIPLADEYLALLVAFEWSDFSALGPSSAAPPPDGFVHGPIGTELGLSLEQLVRGGHRMSPVLVARRRTELLWIIQESGHSEVASMGREPKTSSRVFAMLQAAPSESQSAHEVARALALSESTLRRRLNDEGTTLQAIRDQVRLGLGLHLIQTSSDSVAQIALMCGYRSQSRFSARFKQRFGLSPQELRRTRMTE